MTKASIREFRLTSSGEEGLHPYLDEHGAFLGQGMPLISKTFAAKGPRNHFIGWVRHFH